MSGSAGFVGLNLVTQLPAKIARIVVLADLSTDLHETFPKRAPALEVLRGTVTDLGLLKELVRDSTTVIHAAARNYRRLHAESPQEPRGQYRRAREDPGRTGADPGLQLGRGAVEATLLAALSPESEEQVYNVGTGRETSVNRLARTILRLTGSRSPMERFDWRAVDNIWREVVNIEKMPR